MSNRKQILIVGAGAIGGLYAAFLARVAEAAGVTLEFDPMYLVKNIRSGEAPLTKHAGSMAQDIANGRETEIDALTGYMVRKGKELGVAMPVAERARLGDRLLVEGNLRAGGEEQVLDAGHGHRCDNRVAHMVGRDVCPRGGRG